MYDLVVEKRLAQILAKMTNQRYVYLSSPLDAVFGKIVLSLTSLL
jgi:predicted transcriptional regulator